MELVETRNQTENANDTQSIKEALKKWLDKNSEGGEITLNDFCKFVPNASRTDVVRLLKKSGQGVFITGRRGRLSRFVSGQRALPFIARTNVAPKASPKGEQHSPATISSSEGSTQFELRVGIGDQVTTIPIKLELALTQAA